MKTAIRWLTVFGLAVVALALMGAPAAALPSGKHILFVGAIAGNSVVPNLVSDLNQAFKKTQSGMIDALQDQTPELRWLRKTPMSQITPSGLEMRLILNVLWSKTGAKITDGGYENTTDVPAPQYGTVSFTTFNSRFVLTGLGRLFDRYGKAGEVIQLNMYSARKCIEGMGRKIGMETYGYSTGTVALSDGAASGTTGVVITLKCGFGSTLIASSNATATTRQKKYLAQLFRGMDSIAIFSSGSLITNGQGAITATSDTNGTITADFPGAVSISDGDAIVFFNTVIGTTAASTELNLWVNGMLDVTQSASLHGLATSDAPNWASYTDTTGGYMNFLKVRNAEQYINNYGGTEPNRMIISNGALNAATNAQRSAMIYPGTSSFDLDGNLSKKGVEIVTSVLAPPALSFIYDDEVYTKGELGDLPSEKGSPDLFEFDKLPNQSQWAASLLYAYYRACQNRAAVTCQTSLTEA